MGKTVRTKEQEAAIKTLSKEELEIFNAMPEDRQVEMLSVMEMTSTVDSSVAFEEIGQDEEENVAILSAGGIGCTAGKVITARLLGTMPMFSKDHKENWDKNVINGKTFYSNAYYLFEDPKSQKKFGIYKSPMLNKVLPKLYTKASNKNIATNPMVRIEYVGKVVGKDKLKEVYDLVIPSGNEAHVHLVQLEKGTSFNKFKSGCVNYLRNPIPNLSDKEEISDLERAERDWAQLDLLNSDQAAIGNTTQSLA